ncbi:MAG: DUF4157 domain-containing protein [Anaerolineae bacterium]
MGLEPQLSFEINGLPSTLPRCCIRVLGRPGWFDPALLWAVRLRPVNLLVRAISSRRVTGTRITATTIGDTIYFRRPERFDPHSPAGLALLAHELRHVEQYRAWGGVVPFSVAYVWEYLREGYGTNIFFEAEAHEVAGTVQAHLEAELTYNDGELPCLTPPSGHMPNPLYRYLRPCPTIPRLLKVY